MTEPLRLQTTDLRREGLKVALKHIDRGGMVEIYHYKDLVALMVPPETGEEMPETLPVIFKTTTGNRGAGLPGRWSVEPLPEYWHVSVADRAAKNDTLITVLDPAGQEVASVVYDGRFAEDDEELAEAVKELIDSTRKQAK